MSNIAHAIENNDMARIVAAMPQVSEWVEVKIQDLSCRAMNWLTACLLHPEKVDEGEMTGGDLDLYFYDDAPAFSLETNAQAFEALINEERIGLLPTSGESWMATLCNHSNTRTHTGQSRVQAAQKVFIHVYLGDSVWVPSNWV